MQIHFISPPLSPASAGHSAQRKEEAAREFEAMMIAQLLKTAREAGKLGPPSEDEASGSETYLELAEQQFARIMAASGSFGFARLILAELDRPGENEGA